MFPRHTYFAIEPSASMRIGLMTRIMMLLKHNTQVTVIADTFQNHSTKSFCPIIWLYRIFNQNDRKYYE